MSRRSRSKRITFTVMCREYDINRGSNRDYVLYLRDDEEYPTAEDIDMWIRLGRLLDRR